MKQIFYNKINLVALSFSGLAFFALFGNLNAQTIKSVENTDPVERKNDITLVTAFPDVGEGSNESAMLERLNLKDSRQGGIESFYFANDSSNNWRIFIDGRWLLRPEEISLNFELTDKEKVFLDVSYSHWVEFDYGVGTFDPTVALLKELSDPSLEKQINRFQLNLRYQVSDELRIELAYKFFERKGESLSTRFGDTFAFAFGGPRSRGIVPSVISKNESVNAIGVKVVRETSEKLTGIRLHYQRQSVEESRVAERSSEDSVTNRYTTQTEDSVDDLFAASIYRRTLWSVDTSGSVGIAFTQLDGSLSGNRIFGNSPEAQYDPDFVARQLNDRGFLNLDNSRRLRQWILNANLAFRQTKPLKILFGTRYEHLSSNAFSSYLDTFDRIDWDARARQNEEAEMLSNSEKTATKLSGFGEVKYTGFENFQLFSRLETAIQKGDLDELSTRQEISPDSRAVETYLDRQSEFDLAYNSLESGVTWIPSSKIRVSLKGYLKYRDNDYTQDRQVVQSSLAGEYPGFVENQKFLTKDVNLRLHWRLFSSLKSISRLDLQSTTIKTTSAGNSELQSSENKRMILSQSITWMPHYRIFFMGTFNLVDDLTETGAADLQGTFENVIVNLPNDYWQTNLDLYLILTKRLDLQLRYSYLEMNNFFDNSAQGISFGEDLDQHNMGADLIMRFTPQLIARMGYQYYESNDSSSNGLKDYRVHLIRTSVQFIF